MTKDKRAIRDPDDVEKLREQQDEADEQEDEDEEEDE